MLPVGNPATGVDFIDRVRETELIHTKMESDNVILLAPRRFGKTSVMLKVAEDLKILGKKATFLEVEDVYTPSEFITEMIMSLTELNDTTVRTILVSIFEKSGSWIENHFLEINSPILKATLRGKVQTELYEDWLNIAKKLVTMLNVSDETFYFIIDEFPIAIQNMKNANEDEAKRFLQWFRKLRQTSPNVKFLVGGSVSIDSIVRNAGGIELINDFDRVNIEGFDKEVALQVSEKMIGKERYTLNIGEKILECIGEPYIPYFLMIVLSLVEDECKLHDKEITEELIEGVYNNKILGSQGRHYFQHYYDRLKDGNTYRGMGEKASKAILEKVCLNENYDLELAFDIYKKETGDCDRSTFMDLISNLKNDFYIESDSEHGLKFYSKMLSDWWRIYYANPI